MEYYIYNVIRHVYDSPYGSCVYTWDVVNEFVHASEDSDWRGVYNYEGTIAEFVKKAFELSYDCLAEYDLESTVSLFYNDFNTYMDKDKIIALVNYINSDRRVCAGVGMQSHVGTTFPSVAYYLEAMQAFVNAGFEVQVTELDIGNTSEIEQSEYVYDLLTGILNIKKNGGNITGLTLWGIDDEHSWVGENHALLFSSFNVKKESYYAAMDAYEDVVGEPGFEIEFVPTEAIDNGTIENTNQWEGYNGASLDLGYSTKYEGNHSLKVKNRTATNAGAAQNVTGKIEMGYKYEVSAAVRFNNYENDGATGQTTFKMCIEYGDGTVEELGKVTTGSETWALISGTYTVPAGVDLSQVKIIFVTEDNTNPTAQDLVVFFIDAISVKGIDEVESIADEVAAYKVDAVLGAIGTIEVSKEFKESLQKARNAYERLTESQKQLVNNYSKLVEAEDTYEELDAAEQASQVILNKGFESGDQNWQAYNNSTLGLGYSTRYSGERSLKVVNRTATCDGVSQDITGKVTAGTTYKLNAYFFYRKDENASATGETTFVMGIEYGDGTKATMATAASKFDNWASLKGTYQIPADADLSSVKVYFETAYAENPTVQDLVTYFIDDVSMVVRMTSEPTVAPTAEPNPSEEPVQTPTVSPDVPTDIPTEEPTEEPTDVPTQEPTKAPTQTTVKDIKLVLSEDTVHPAGCEYFFTDPSSYTYNQDGSVTLGLLKDGNKATGFYFNTDREGIDLSKCDALEIIVSSDVTDVAVRAAITDSQIFKFDENVNWITVSYGTVNTTDTTITIPLGDGFSERLGYGIGLQHCGWNTSTPASPTLTIKSIILKGVEVEVPVPTPEPTIEPTQAPTQVPTAEPTQVPTQAPTAKPTQAPTAEPTKTPTAEPTKEPTAEPTKEPTAEPTKDPTKEPTPTQVPTIQPTGAPIIQPTNVPISNDDNNGISDASKSKVIKMLSIKVKKNSVKIKGKVSVSKATVKIKVGKNKWKKAKVKGKKFTLKVPKLIKKTKVKIKVTKKGYKSYKKTYKVK